MPWAAAGVSVLVIRSLRLIISATYHGFGPCDAAPHLHSQTCVVNHIDETREEIDTGRSVMI